MDQSKEFISKFSSYKIQTTEQAEFYIEIEKSDDLINCVTEARKLNLPVYVIGSGSWPHLPEKQIKGILIKNNCRKFSVYAMSGIIKRGIHHSREAKVNKTLVYTESGTPVNQLVRYTIEEGLSGLEYHLGLPGTVGGALFTNARYKPKNLYFCDFVEKISVLNNKNEIVDRPPEYFASRSHNFDVADDIILSVLFKLLPEDKKTLWQREDEALEYRNEKKKLNLRISQQQSTDLGDG